MRLNDALRQFAARQDGGIAIAFGLSLIMLCLAVGLAMDYSRGYSVEVALQSDLDAALLRAASELENPDAIQAAAQTFFNENWTAKHSASSVVLTVAKTSDSRVVGTATVAVPTTLMKLGGFETINLTATSEVEVAGGNVELAMVLDTTASMEGAKLQALKVAAKSLIETAYEEPDADQHVKVAIVPFGQYVNVGIGNRNEPWMSVDADHSEPRQTCGDQYTVTGTSNCRMETFTGSRDGIPYTYDADVCDYTYSPPVYQCTDWTEWFTWNGCAGSRNSPLDTKDEDYSTPIPGVMNAGCGSPITTLTNDKTILEQNIDALTASGDTYIPTGLMWGWSALSSIPPFNDGVAYGVKVDGKPVHKVMVLMTDGFNTLSPTYPQHDGGDRTQANTLTSELCANIKAKDVTIYTVAFEVADNAIKDILQGCATGPSRFFDASDAEELTAAFRNIARDFSPLRIAR